MAQGFSHKDAIDLAQSYVEGLSSAVVPSSIIPRSIIPDMIDSSLVPKF